MIQGLILNFFPPHSKFVSSWVKGQPKNAWFTDTKVVAMKARIPIGAFRRKGCGYLESYADEKFAAE
jgi:hypothetical protein